MRKYKNVSQKNRILNSVVCNHCGREISVASQEEYFHGEILWGYLSNQDGRKDSFDLCQKCYEIMVENFSVKMEEN